MNKKGVELSFNVVIIAIIVILVLVVLASFFVGGFTKLAEIIFGQSVDSLESATTTCTTSCSRAQLYESTIQKRNSGYCTKTWRFDEDKDGNTDRDAEGNLKKYYCYQTPINVDCPGVKNSCEEQS